MNAALELIVKIYDFYIIIQILNKLDYLLFFYESGFSGNVEIINVTITLLVPLPISTM